MHMRHRLVLLLAAIAIACAPASPRPPRVRPLVVGTNGASPPYAFRRDGQLVGLEIDLARELGHALGRPVDLLDLPFIDLFSALGDGRVDVVMSGITITKERQVRLAFADPYLQTGLGALIRRRDEEKFRDRDAVCKRPIDVGVVGGTIGEKVVRDRCPATIPRVYPRAEDAVLELRQRRLDAVVHDAPVLAWLGSQNESELEFITTRIVNEQLAWAFRPDESQLRDAANQALARMRADGTLDRIIARWVPQWTGSRAD